MAADLQPIVNVSITRDTLTVTRQGFGTTLILGYFDKSALDSPWAVDEKWRSYEKPSEAAADGFDSTMQVYRELVNVFAQTDAPDTVVIACLDAAPSFERELTITDATEGNLIRVSVLRPGQAAVSEIEYTILAGASTTTVATAVASLIDALSGVDASSAGAVITITPTTDGTNVYLSALTGCTQEETTADAGYDDFLDDLLEDEDLSFFHVIIDSTSDDNVGLVSTWAETNRRVYWGAVGSSSTKAGSNTAVEAAVAASRDFSVFHYPKAEYTAEAGALAGFAAGKDPGTYTMRKTIKNVVSAGLSSTQRTALTADNVNYARRYRNVTLLEPGKTASGEWIDIIIGIEALAARIQEDIFSAVTSPDKLPISTKGLDAIRNAALAAAQAFETQGSSPGLLVEGSTVVTVPSIDDVSDADKQAREVNGVQIDATLEQAAHYVGVSITVHN